MKERAKVFVYKGNISELFIQESGRYRAIELKDDFYRVNHNYKKYKGMGYLEIPKDENFENLIKIYHDIVQTKKHVSYNGLNELLVKSESKLSPEEQGELRQLNEDFYRLTLNVMGFDKLCHKLFDKILNYLV